MHGVEPKTVEGIVPQPHLDVVQHETANLVRVLSVVVECAPPGRLVLGGEIRSEDAEVIPLGTDVVIDNVEDHRDASRVTRVDEPVESLGSAICMVRRVEVHAVIAPSAPPRKLGDRHDLDRVDTELLEVIEPT